MRRGRSWRKVEYCMSLHCYTRSRKSFWPPVIIVPMSKGKKSQSQSVSDKLLHTTYWDYTLMVNWFGPIEVGPLYTLGLIRCLPFFICLIFYSSKLYVLYSQNLNFTACNIVHSKAGFYLSARSKPVLYPAQGWIVLKRNRRHWTIWSLWTVLQTGVDSYLDKNATGNKR